MTKTANILSNDISQLKQTITEQILSNQLSSQKYEMRINKYEEKVDLYREEINHKEEKITHQQEDLVRRDEELAKVKSENDCLKELVRLLKHHRFGRKSESVQKDNNQLELGIFNEAEEFEDKSCKKVSDIEVKGYHRSGKKPKRIKLPDNLPREEIIIDLAEEEKFCPKGHALKCIGEDVSEQLDIIPAQVKVIKTIRKKYACPVCEDYVERAPLPKKAIPKSIASNGLLAYIATNKYGDGLPLYRQEHMWQRLGVNIPRATMASWMIKVGELLTPVINLMEEDLLESGYVHVDETRVQVLKEPGKRPESLSYMWVRGRKYPGAPPIVLFEYDPTKSGDVAKRLFVDYKGYLQADGYAGYNDVCKNKEVVRLGCMAHCRRKFFEVTKASSKGIGLATEVIDLIAKLYKVEKTIKDKSIEERHLTRIKESKLILDEIRKLIDENLAKVPPSSCLGKALSYANNEWVYLIRYLDDGRLAIDNNMVENAIRPFAIGRKNWLFSSSVAGAKASAAIYSIMLSAKLNDHNEYLYLRHLLEKLPLAKSLEDYEALLPHRLPPQDIHSLK